MSQWNNSYAYNQYQGANSWNGDPNSQYMNQSYYANRQEPSNQYVSFNEFLTQIQGTSAMQPSTANYNQAQFENYPTNQFEYQNMPSTSQNNSYNYTATTTNISNGSDNYQGQQQYNTLPDQNSYTNEVILKSNLTPTAMEFVPKSAIVQPSSSSQNIPDRAQANQNSNNVGNEPRSHHNNSSESNWRERPTSSQNGEGSLKYESNGRSQENYRSQEKGPSRDSNHRNNESNGRYYESNNRNHDSNNRNYESGTRNQEPNNRSFENTRSHETNSRFENRNEKRNQSKQNSKVKGKDSDARTFYNSSINKDSQDVRNGRSEGGGRNRNWAGSQRLKATERNSVEDEEYANTYLQRKDEKVERVSKSKNVLSSPSRFKSKASSEIAITEMTQRERLTEQLDKGTLECLVCCERVKQTDPVWSCGNCYHVLHLRCIRKWAMSSMVEGKWRCPACQNTSSEIPGEYRCMCGAVRSPEHQRGAGGAHTCGRACRRARRCVHPCTLLCHPGPCPPCQATVQKQCGCGAETRSVLCSSKLPQVCGRVCHRTLECGVHTCIKECHEGPCDACAETIEQVCYCPVGKSRSVGCARPAAGGAAGGAGAAAARARWSCGAQCSRVLACGAHVCRDTCHAPPCDTCPLLPGTVLTCPCGNTRLDKGQRKSCTDPIPLCGNICAKPLQCGPAGDKHFCKLDCHQGACPVCPDKTVLQCRCGHSSREVPCADLPQMYNNVLCQKKCNKKLSCGRHHCRTVCCAGAGAGAGAGAAGAAAGAGAGAQGGAHRCLLTCARSLPCQLHRCEELCHTGRCAPCPRLSFEELTCECGAEVVLPPIRCGTKPPACTAPCRRERPCGHPPHHSCHSGDCPPCVVLTAKHCHGRHEERKTIPCSQEEFSCGLPCGKPLPCGKHTCTKTCHKGPCDTGKCSQPCNEKRARCGHPCAAPCHSATGTACPSGASCRRAVRATCPCGRRHADRPCSDNSRDYTKMMSALAATKIQEGGSVDLSDVQRPGNMLKTLECDDECRVEARTRRLALALQIRNPDVSAKLAPRYSDHVRSTAAREPAFALHVHDKLTDLVQLAKKSKQKTRSHSFPSMNWQKRQFIHELCEHFGCESVAYDAEPNRNVVATADKEKSWLPAMSVMEVLSREAGRRRVPPPVLRAPALAAPAHAHAHGLGQAQQPQANNNKSSGGWATLTSTNAWAARSQRVAAAAPAPTSAAAPAPVEAKIDYFDNPPDN